MSQAITPAQLQEWLLLYADRIHEQESLLTELDAAIGDADHGINMQRGMTKVRQRLTEMNGNEPGIAALLRSVAMTLISSVGGAAGPLYGAFFLRAAKDVNGNQVLSLVELATMFRSGLDGIQQRGKAKLDDKTMVDALQPAVVALEDAATSGKSVLKALNSARQAAEAGMKHTSELEAKKGRASYMGPRSIGHQDPGATSLYFLIETAALTLGHIQNNNSQEN